MNDDPMIKEFSNLSSKLSELVKINNEILKWTRFANRLKLKELLEKVLISENEKLMYELTEDNSSARDIAQRCGVTHGTVVNYWKKWKIMGILESTEKYAGKRYRKICSLLELGIDVPLAYEQLQEV